MFSIQRVISLCLLALMMTGTPLAGADRIFLLPSGLSSLVTVLDAADLSLQGSIPANFTSFKVLRTPTADKYLILTRSAPEAIIVVDADSLTVLRRVSLESGVSDGDLSPDGRTLLLAADKLRVVRVAAQEEVIAEIDVGGGAEQIAVSAASNQAFVLANAGRVISVVDLDSFEVTNTLQVPSVRSIALASSEDRLLALAEDGILQFRTSDQAELPAVPSSFEIRNGAELLVIPNSPRVLVRNTGAAPRNTSLVFDLDERTVKPVGIAGSTGLRKALVLGPNRAFAILNSTQSLAEIDLDATPSATVTPLDLGISALNLGASPNLKQVYVSSSIDSSVTIVDPETVSVTATTTVPVAPRGHSVIFGPSTKPPANIIVSSGNNQFVPPGATTPSALSVTITDEDDVPLFGVPVLFSAGEDVGLEFLPSEIVTTNVRGVAAVLVSVPVPTEPNPGEGEGAVALEENAAANQPLQAEGQSSAPALGQPPGAAQESATVQPVVITAITPSGPSADFTLNIIRTTGIIKISGDFQITEEREPFPEPFVILATDQAGTPLPPGTPMLFAAFTAICGDLEVPLDLNGFASVRCTAEPLIPGAGTTRDGSLTVSVKEQFDLGTAVFTITTAIGARSIRLDKVAGDGQVAPTGTTLPTPLTFQINNLGTPLGSTGVGVQIRQKSGPAVVINPTFAVARLNFVVPVEVTLGPRAGNVVIEAVANAPGKPSTEFTVEATGGLLVRFEKEGDGQSARIGRFLANPLRMRVFNESGQKVPFPEVQWSVVNGEATLLTARDSDGATARVQFGLTQGPVVVQGRIDGLVATFTVTATPPLTTAILPVNGEDQTVQVGDTSEPLTVEVLEIGDLPAFGAPVTFSGPLNVLFHAPEEESEPSNPLELIADQNGRATARVELLGLLAAEEGNGEPPAQSAAAVPITVSAGPQIFTTFLINPLGRTPVFEATGISNAAAFVPGLVPGSLAALFGEGLSEAVTGTEMPGGVLLFRGLSIKVGGLQAPILTVTRGENEQINFQVPFEVPPGQVTAVEVDNNGSSSMVSGVPVFSAQPGIFQVEGVAETPVGAVVHPADFSLVTPANPAQRGAAVALFFTGGGLLEPPVATGEPGPDPPALMVLPVSARVDGKAAAISFQGYAPGLLGVYQLNLTIPEDSECGSRPLSLSVGGADSPASTVAVQCP